MKEYKTPVIEEVNGDNTISDVFESWGYCKAYVDRALAELSRYRLTGMTPGEIAEMRRRNSAETHDGWIPVEERLPHDEAMMLVTCQTKAGRKTVNRAWYGTGCWHGTGSMSGVIAWMPLPEPYSPERSNDAKE